MNTVEERLLIIQDDLKITKIKLGEISGSKTPSQSVNNWIKRDSISKDAARELSKKTGYSYQWILDGTGSPQQDGIPLSELKSRLVDEWDSKTPLNDDEVAVPYYKSIELAAGYGSANNEDYNGFKLRFGKAFFRRKNVQKDNVMCFPVRGNSMEPVIPNGSTLSVLPPA